jgi:hypothetical protein
MKMPTTSSARHRVEIPGLAEAIAAAQVTDKHPLLLKAVRGFEPLHSARLATTRDQGGRLVKRKVLDPAGQLVHEDHREWLRLEIEADAGHVGTTQARLRDKGFLLTVCQVQDIYLVHDRGGPNQANFLQVKIQIIDEWVDRQMFSRHSSWRDAPRNLRDLVDAAEDGDTLDGEARRRFSPSAYVLEKVVDIALFIEEAEELEALKRAKLKQRRVNVTSMTTGVETAMSWDELSPGWDRHPTKAKRLFDDWTASSAGRSGARICEHWVMQTTDWTDPDGERWLSLIPAWTFDKTMAKIPSNKGGSYELFGKLEKIDQRTKAPFAWYFYMLHGNKVGDGAGRRILAAAEDGLIVLAEHDYRVLSTWNESPYGF